MGSPFYTIDDILKPHQKKYQQKVKNDNNHQIQDIDDLNTDICTAAIQLIQNTMNNNNNSTSNVKNISIIEKTYTKIQNLKFENCQLIATQTRPSCRFEIIKRSFFRHPHIQTPFSTPASSSSSSHSNSSNSSTNTNSSTSKSSNSNLLIDIDIILDIAHNHEAMKELMRKMKLYYPAWLQNFRLVLVSIILLLL